MEGRSLFHNVSVALVAQLTVLVGGTITTLILPRALGVTEFGYWQLLLLYVGYAGVAHLGLNDGVYLLNGGKTLNELDRGSISTQFRIGLAIQVALGAGLAGVTLSHVLEPSRRDVLIYTAIIMVLTNCASFIGLVLQAVNRTRTYSMSVVVRQSVYVAGIVMLVACGATTFQPYAAINALAATATLLFLLWFGRSFVFCRGVGIGRGIRDAAKSISVGVSLLLAGLASMLIVGISRFAVDDRWGIDDFSVYSLAVTLTSLFMLFASQVGMVLFPALRRLSGAQLSKFYGLARDLLDWALPAVFLLYYPVAYFVGFWLPDYTESVSMLAVLLPVAVFDTKMSILGSTILKVVRRERYLLAVNVLAVGLSSVLVGVAIQLHSLSAVACAVSVAIAFRYVMADLTVVRELGLGASWTTWASGAAAGLFAFVAATLSAPLGFTVTAVSYALFTVLARGRIKLAFTELRRAGRGRASSK